MNLAVMFLQANSDPNNVSSGCLISISCLLKFKLTIVVTPVLTPVHPNVLIVLNY